MITCSDCCVLDASEPATATKQSAQSEICCAAVVVQRHERSEQFCVIKRLSQSQLDIKTTGKRRSR